MKYFLLIISVLLFLGCSEKKTDGASIFNSECASCHGKMAEKSAFGKSQIIVSWSKENIVKAMKGYQSGTYGRSMKRLMSKQVKSMTDEEIDAVAEYISKIY
ncbi:c-type cytochrome [Sulfurospirillum arcachonense]|uniref:c-type cytochrome n=1 Tax=Sulfurospirillum arcachonense TaxID=57666 RepID=UPI00046B0A2A|nr:c-type cytochrome [Sulfurospirillum arcachonense]